MTRALTTKSESGINSQCSARSGGLKGAPLDFWGPVCLRRLREPQCPLLWCLALGFPHISKLHDGSVWPTCTYPHRVPMCLSPNTLDLSRKHKAWFAICCLSGLLLTLSHRHHGPWVRFHSGTSHKCWPTGGPRAQRRN